jgi:hypothetical protein
MMRDLFVDDSYWNEWIAFHESLIVVNIQAIELTSKNPSYRPQYVRDLAFFHIKLSLYRYARGDAVSELLQYFEPFLHYWEESERLGKEVWTPAQQHTRHTWSVNLDHYIDCFWLVGLALSLNIPDVQWQRLLVLIGNEGQDLLLDRIIATRQPTRHIGDTLCYPKPYARLLKAIDAPQTKQAGLLNAFVEHWYLEVGKAAKSGREKQAIPYKEPYWHGYHFPMKGAYFGYWCLEAVAAVKAFGLDDSLCLGHPHYPGDLLRPGSVTAANALRLLPELAESIGKEPTPPFVGEPRIIGNWEAFKGVIKNKFKR